MAIRGIGLIFRSLSRRNRLRVIRAIEKIEREVSRYARRYNQLERSYGRYGAVAIVGTLYAWRGDFGGLPNQRRRRRRDNRHRRGRRRQVFFVNKQKSEAKLLIRFPPPQGEVTARIRYNSKIRWFWTLVAPRVNRTMEPSIARRTPIRTGKLLRSRSVRAQRNGLYRGAVIFQYGILYARWVPRVFDILSSRTTRNLMRKGVESAAQKALE